MSALARARPGRVTIARPCQRPLVAGALMALGALGAAMAGLMLGDYPMAPPTCCAPSPAAAPRPSFIVGELRLPRLVTALLVGAALALAGAIFQSLVRNPLGSPDVLGFTQGAATGALVVVVLGGGTWPARRGRGRRRPAHRGGLRWPGGAGCTATGWCWSASASPRSSPASTAGC